MSVKGFFFILVFFLVAIMGFLIYISETVVVKYLYIAEALMLLLMLYLILFYRKIGTTALDTVKPGGNLYFEINANLGNETVNLLAGLGYRNIELLKDMQQRDRIVSAILP